MSKMKCFISYFSLASESKYLQPSWRCSGQKTWVVIESFFLFYSHIQSIGKFCLFCLLSVRTHTHTHTHKHMYTHNMCSLSPLLHCSKQLSSLYLIVAMAFGWPTCFPFSSSYLLASQQPGWCFSVHIILCNSFIQKTVSQPTWFGSWFHLLMKSSLWFHLPLWFHLLSSTWSLSSGHTGLCVGLQRHLAHLTSEPLHLMCSYPTMLFSETCLWSNLASARLERPHSYLNPT